MNKQYSFVANSSVMFFICGLAILVVLVQAAIFFRAAYEAIRIDSQSGSSEGGKEQHRIFHCAVTSDHHQLYDLTAGPREILSLASVKRYRFRHL